MDNENRIIEAIHYINIGRYEKSIEILFDLLSEDPDSGYYLYLAAKCYYCVDNYSEALKYCAESIEKGYGIEDCKFLMGQIHSEFKNYSLSEECYLEVLRLNSQNAAAFAAYGMLMLKTGHEKKAVKLLDEAMRLDPQNEIVLHYKFMYYLVKDKPKEQLSTLKNYMVYANDEKNKLIKLGIYNMYNQKPKEARENIRQAYLMDPTDNDVLQLLKEVCIDSSIIHLPQRLIQRVGGPVVLWISFIILVVVLRSLKLYTIQMYVVLIYLVIVVYTWITPLINKVVGYYQNK